MNDLAAQTPSPTRLRAKLEQMVIADLLGPAGGPDEEVVERTVRDRYLVGVLAPRRRRDERPPEVVAPATATDGADEDEFPRSSTTSWPRRASSAPRTGPPSCPSPCPGPPEPSSFGMTFCVEESAGEIVAVASWGQYLRPQKEERTDPATGRVLRLWKRHPRGGRPHRISLRLGPIRPIVADPACPDVTIQGVVRRCDPCWIVTLFLVNGQEEGRPKDQSWLFQPRLEVEAPDGAAAFIKKMTRGLSEKLDGAFRPRRRRLAMLYRRHVEFAVGHGISVHVDVAPGPGPCRAGRAPRSCRAYEVPRTTPPTARRCRRSTRPSPSWRALVLDMKLLAEANPKQYPAEARPLVEAYEDWIDREEKRIDDPAEGLASTSSTPPSKPLLVAARR